MLTELLPMLYPAGAAPDNFTVRSGNAPVIMATLRTNQKVTQYTLRVIPGGLPLTGVFINVVALTLLPLHQKEVLKANDIADVLLIGEQAAEYRLRPAFFSFEREYSVLKKEISNPAQPHAREVLLIDGSDDVCFFGIYNDTTIR